MNRRELREHTFKLLFRAEFNEPEDMPEQVTLYFDDMPGIEQKDLEYIKGRCEDILGRLPEIDEKLGQASKGWNLSRMGKVELTLLRLALYEILYDEDIPTGVAINEAVELAKNFGQDGASAFVNGVLAKMV